MSYFIIPESDCITVVGMSYNIQITAEDVPAILVAGGLIAAIVGITGSISALTFLGVGLIGLGVIIYLLKERIIKL